MTDYRVRIGARQDSQAPSGRGEDRPRQAAPGQSQRFSRVRVEDFLMPYYPGMSEEDKEAYRAKERARHKARMADPEYRDKKAARTREWYRRQKEDPAAFEAMKERRRVAEKKKRWGMGG